MTFIWKWCPVEILPNKSSFPHFCKTLNSLSLLGLFPHSHSHSCQIKRGAGHWRLWDSQPCNFYFYGTFSPFSSSLPPCTVILCSIVSHSDNHRHQCVIADLEIGWKLSLLRPYGRLHLPAAGCDPPIWKLPHFSLLAHFFWFKLLIWRTHCNPLSFPQKAPFSRCAL